MGIRRRYRRSRRAVNPRAAECYSPPTVALAVGSRIGPYEVVGQLGAGGMGVVYRARDTKLSREVALKVLPDSVHARPGPRGALPPRSPVARVAEPPEHRRHLRPRGGGRRQRSRPGARRRADARRAHRPRPSAARRSAAARGADRAGARSRPRSRDRSPGPEAFEREAAARRDAEGPRLRARQVRGRARACAPRIGVADADVARRGHAGRHDPRHGRLHEPGAGARPAGRRADRRLGVRLRADGDAHRQARVPGRERVGHDRERPARRAELERSPRGGGARRAGAATLPGEGPRAALPRRRGRDARAGRRREIVLRGSRGRGPVSALLARADRGDRRAPGGSGARRPGRPHGPRPEPAPSPLRRFELRAAPGGPVPGEPDRGGTSRSRRMPRASCTPRSRGAFPGSSSASSIGWTPDSSPGPKTGSIPSCHRTARRSASPPTRSSSACRQRADRPRRSVRWRPTSAERPGGRAIRSCSRRESMACSASRRQAASPSGLRFQTSRRARRGYVRPCCCPTGKRCSTR